MSRQTDLKQLNRQSRNRLRSILSIGGDDAIHKLLLLRAQLGKQQTAALESVLSSPAPLRGARRGAAFPKSPPFADRLHGMPLPSLESLLSEVDQEVATHQSKLLRLAGSLGNIDVLIAATRFHDAATFISDVIDTFGWSHALLRRLAFIRESFVDTVDDVEDLVNRAGLQSSRVVVTSLINAFAPEQNYLTIKRSILNIVDRGSINRFSRILSRLTVRPHANDAKELAEYLAAARNASLIDAIIWSKFNSHLFDISGYPNLAEIAAALGKDNVVQDILKLYPANDAESEYLFYKQSATWLEYDLVRKYRILTDAYYDSSAERAEPIHPKLSPFIAEWIGDAAPRDLVSGARFTKHGYLRLAEMEASGVVTRSALFNYWLRKLCKTGQAQRIDPS